MIYCGADNASSVFGCCSFATYANFDALQVHVDVVPLMLSVLVQLFVLVTAHSTSAPPPPPSPAILCEKQSCGEQLRYSPGHVWPDPVGVDEPQREGATNLVQTGK